MNLRSSLNKLGKGQLRNATSASAASGPEEEDF